MSLLKEKYQNQVVKALKDTGRFPSTMDVPRLTKVFALIILWVGLITSILLVEILFVRLILLAVGIVVSIHILSLKTLEKAQLDAAPPPEPEESLQKETE